MLMCYVSYRENLCFGIKLLIALAVFKELVELKFYCTDGGGREYWNRRYRRTVHGGCVRVVSMLLDSLLRLGLVLAIGFLSMSVFVVFVLLFPLHSFYPP